MTPSHNSDKMDLKTIIKKHRDIIDAPTHQQLEALEHAMVTKKTACAFALFMKEEKAVELITEGESKGKWVGVIGDTLGKWTTEQLFEIFLRD